jgi:hypothetical protein
MLVGSSGWTSWRVLSLEDGCGAGLIGRCRLTTATIAFARNERLNVAKASGEAKYPSGEGRVAE